MNEPLISIIVPIYKVEEYLDECVTSLVNQTYKNLEIILVDDGSPDKCPQMCDEWSAKDSRIKVIHKHNGGLSDARNVGVDNARGEYIGFVDSDDFVDEKMYEVLINGIQSHEDTICASVGIYRFENGNIERFKHNWHLEVEYLRSSQDFAFNNLSERSSFPVWNKLYKAEIIRLVRFRKGILNEDTVFDFDLGLELLEKYSNTFYLELPFYGYYYRYRSNSICVNSMNPLILSVLANLETMMYEIEGKHKTLYSLLSRLYTIKLYSFLNEIIYDDKQKKRYYDEHMRKFKSIPIKFKCKHLSIHCIFKSYMIIYIPHILKYTKFLEMLFSKTFK